MTPMTFDDIQRTYIPISGREKKKEKKKKKKKRKRKKEKKREYTSSPRKRRNSILSLYISFFSLAPVSFIAKFHLYSTSTKESRAIAVDIHFIYWSKS